MDPSELIQQKQELEVLEKKMKSTITAIFDGLNI
jgi:hypothetical protein